MNAEHASLYRAIMQVFTEAKERFGLHLRPQEVASALGLATFAEPVDAPSVESALQQLCEWGNVERHPDTADVATVEEFYRPRFLYQLTLEGEAAERAFAFYAESVQRPGELQSAALSDIRALLEELAQLAGMGEPDEGKTHRTLMALRGRFDELTSQARTFIGSLQRSIDLQGVTVDAFLAYKDTLIGYLERFIGELVLATADIADTVQRIEDHDVRRLLRIAARRDLADALAPNEEDHEASVRSWQARWAGLRRWFIGLPDAPSQAEVLRARARSAIPSLLNAIVGINDRRMTRSDRSADLRTLARWFAEADSDRDAHRLWRAAFALAPARHLRVDDDTLDERESDPVSPQTSWLDAPPLRISPRLRALGWHAHRGRPQNVIDRANEKAMLARVAEAEAEQIAAARQRLATGRRMRLSEIGELNRAEFDLFLDLLGEALARKVHPNDAVQAISSDGALRIALKPTGDARTAEIRTAAGRFFGRDHYVTIDDTFGDVEMAASASAVHESTWTDEAATGAQ